MSFLGVNPRRNPALETLRRPLVELAGLPIPLAPTLAEVSGQKSPMDFIHELTKRLAAPRANRDAIFDEIMPKLKAGKARFFGTSQQHFMVQSQETLFAAFVPDLMTADEREAFLTHWRIRGMFPAKIEAMKEGRFWSYRLIERPKFL